MTKLMIYQMDSDIWFDADKLYVIKGNDHYLSYLNNQESYPLPENRQASYPPPENRQGVYPCSLVFLSSTACNLKCKYCYAAQGTYHGVSSKNTFMLDNYIEAYEAFLAAFGRVDSIGFFGGEPLLGFREIKSFVEYMHATYPAGQIPSFGISSNGTIMNTEIKEFIARYGITFGTSLDGPKDLNDLNRVSNTVGSVHDTVIGTLSELSDLPVKKAIQFTFNLSHIKNYKSGDATEWARQFESLPIMFYSIIPATTQEPGIEIDLDDAVLRENFMQMCEEFADHCLEALISQETSVLPNNLIAPLLAVIRRKVQSTCGAGNSSFTISPDMRVYPCHVIASEADRGVSLGEMFIEEIREHAFFGAMNSVDKSGISECAQCPAINVCSVFCKGLFLDAGSTVQRERCLMMVVFLRRIVVFLANRYQGNSKAIKDSLQKVSAVQNGTFEGNT